MFKNKRFSFSAIYFLGWAALATYSLDFVFFSERSGFSNTEIGIIYAVKMLIGIVFQPVYGLISDHIRSTRKLLVTKAAAAAVLSICLPLAPSKITIMIIDFSFFFTFCGFMPLLDSWVARECIGEKKFHFGSLRLWGSIGYAIVAFIYGRMTMYIDIAYMYFGRAIFFAIAILFVYSNQYDNQVVFIKKTDKKQKPDIKALFSKKEYWQFFVFLFLFCFPINAANTFFPRVLLEKGSTNQIIALFGSLCAIIEIPFFLYVRKLSEKTGSRGLLLTGAAFVVLRLTGFAFASSVPLLLAAHLCAAPYVTFFMPGIIFHSRRIAPKNTEAFTLTSLQGLAIGISGMLGNYLGGLIADSQGIQSMFAYYSVVCVAGIVFFWTLPHWVSIIKRLSPGITR